MSTTQNNSNKIVLSTFISFLALVVSIIALTHTILTATSEKDRTLRLELTKTLDQINKLQIEDAKIRQQNTENITHYNHVSSILSQQNASLLDYTEFIVKQIPDKVSTVDLNTIAVANALAGFYFKADEFHRKSIEKAKETKDDFSEVLASRSYAQFLMNTGRTMKARKQFEHTINLAENLAGKEQKELVLDTLGYIYLQWGIHEAARNNKNESRIHFDKARQTYNQIKNEFVRKHRIESLNSAISNSESASGKPDCDLVLYGDCI